MVLKFKLVGDTDMLYYLGSTVLIQLLVHETDMLYYLGTTVLIRLLAHETDMLHYLGTTVLIRLLAHGRNKLQLGSRVFFFPFPLYFLPFSILSSCLVLSYLVLFQPYRPNAKCSGLCMSSTFFIVILNGSCCFALLTFIIVWVREANKGNKKIIIII